MLYIDEFFSKYLFWFKVAAGVLLVIGALWAWHVVSEGLIQQGRDETQALWDKQKLVDTAEYVKAMKEAYAREHDGAAAQLAIIKNLKKEKDDELATRDSTINDLRSGLKRMRVITGKAEYTAPGVPDPGASSIGDDRTCSVRIPGEIGEAFAGVKSEFGQLKARLQACQQLLVNDRKVCGE